MQALIDEVGATIAANAAPRQEIAAPGTGQGCARLEYVRVAASSESTAAVTKQSGLPLRSFHVLNSVNKP